MKTRYRLLAAAAIVIGGGVYLYHAAFSAEPANQYLTAPVTRANLQETVLATGTLKPSRLVAVGSQASGRITALKVKLGDTVKQGDLIAEIDSTTQDNALKTAQASLGNVQAQRTEKLADLENAELTLKRQEAIVAKQAGAQADLQSAQAEVKVVNAQIAALDAQIVEAQVASKPPRRMSAIRGSGHRWTAPFLLSSTRKAAPSTPRNRLRPSSFSVISRQ